MIRSSRRASRTLVLSIALAGALIGVACSRDARSHFEQGNAYRQAGKPREALIEYRNAVAKDPSFGEARARLADALLESGDAAGGVREMIRAADLLPNDVDLQVRTGQLLLRTREFDQARARAERALAKAPTRTDAVVLRANALAGLSNFEEAIAQLKDAIAVDPKAAIYTNLGAVQLASGNRAEAEAAYQTAVTVEPKAVEPRLALANFLWSTGRTADAETALKDAYAIDSKHVLTNRALAVLYMSTRRPREAEPLLVAIADTTGRPADRLDLADYYVAIGEADKAVAQLDLVAKDPRARTAARSRRALIEQAGGKTDAALATVDELLKTDPRNLDGLITRARILLAAEKVDEALPLVRTVIEIDPRNLAAHYLLGTIHASRGRVDEAAASFNEVIKLNPRASVAQVQLARLELLRGQPAASVQLAGQALKSAPGNPSARLMLARGYLAQRQLDAAETELLALVKALPNAAPVQAELGRLRLAQRRLPEARAAFEKALAQDATSMDALAGLVGVDVVEGKSDAAAKRVAERLAAAPKDSRLLLLAARVALSTRDVAGAESRLRAAIDADPGNFGAYGLLGQLYLQQGKLDSARAEFETLAGRQPKPVAARTMIGMILQAQGKRAEAQQQYEKVIQIDRRAAVAANNLAWLYAEQGQNLGSALELAQEAKVQLPNVAAIDDTLGYVYLQRNAPDLAVAPLREAIAKEPANPVYHYRLGVAYAKAGKAGDAREALQKSLAINAGFAGADDARKVLQSLGDK